jgi:hypothetical protein
MCSTASCGGFAVLASSARRVKLHRPASSIPSNPRRPRRARRALVLRSSEGSNSARRPMKLSEVTRPTRQFAQRLSSCERSDPRRPAILEERRAVARQVFVQRPRPRRQRQRIGVVVAAQRRPQADVAPLQQRDWRRAHRAARVLALRIRGRRTEPGPDDAAGQAQVVKPGEVVTLQARGRDLTLPAAGAS